MSKPKKDAYAAIGSLMNSAVKLHSQDAQPSPTAAATLAAGATAEKPASSRSCTFLMKGADIAKVDAVVLATQQANGLRISTTDVMRIALKRLADGPASREEVAALRAQDPRRRISTYNK
jgi:hypothetical protein